MYHKCEFCGFTWDCMSDDCDYGYLVKGNCEFHGGTADKYLEHVNSK